MTAEDTARAIDERLYGSPAGFFGVFYGLAIMAVALVRLAFIAGRRISGNSPTRPMAQDVARSGPRHS